MTDKFVCKRCGYVNDNPDIRSFESGKSFNNTTPDEGKVIITVTKKKHYFCKECGHRNDTGNELSSEVKDVDEFEPVDKCIHCGEDFYLWDTEADKKHHQIYHCDDSEIGSMVTLLGNKYHHCSKIEVERPRNWITEYIQKWSLSSIDGKEIKIQFWFNRSDDYPIVKITEIGKGWIQRILGRNESILVERDEFGDIEKQERGFRERILARVGEKAKSEDKENIVKVLEENIRW